MMNNDKNLLTHEEDKVQMTINKQEPTIGRLLLRILVVCICFVSYFILLGFLNNIGSIKPHWENCTIRRGLLMDQAGSVNFAFAYLMSPLACVVMSKLGHGYTYILGCVICSLSLLVPALVHNHVVLFLFYGCFLGTGGCFLMFSVTFLVMDFYNQALSLVNGIIMCGSCFGTFVHAMFLHKFLHLYGWHNVFMVYSAVLLCMSSFGFAMKALVSRELKDSCSPAKKVHTGQMRLVAKVGKKVPFVIFCFSLMIFCVGYLVPFFYLKEYAQHRGVDHSKAAGLIGVFSLGSLAGRMLITFLGDLVGNFRVFFACGAFLVMGGCNIAAPYCHTFVSFLVYSVALGVSDGIIVVLIVPLLNDFLSSPADEAKGEDYVKAIKRIGVPICFIIQALGMILGPFIIKFIIERGFNISALFLFDGATSIVTALLVFSVKIVSIIGAFNL